jgi:hypothetical protein
MQLINLQIFNILLRVTIIILKLGCKSFIVGTNRQNAILKYSISLTQPLSTDLFELAGGCVTGGYHDLVATEQIFSM